MLLDEVLRAGARRISLVVKLAGGAEMFAFAGKDAPKLAVGRRNIEAVHAQLAKLGLRVDREDIGGSHGRTFEVDLNSLMCTIKIVGREMMQL